MAHFYAEGPVQGRGTAPPLVTGRPKAWAALGEITYRMPQGARLEVSDATDTGSRPLPSQYAERFSAEIPRDQSARRSPGEFKTALRPISFGPPLRPTMERESYFDVVSRAGRIVEVRR